MTASPRRMTAAHVEEPNDVDLARLDDDGGGSPVDRTPRVRDDRFGTPLIPGARAAVDDELEPPHDSGDVQD